MPKYWDMGMRKRLFFSNNGYCSDPCCLLTPNSLQSFLQTGQEEGTNSGFLIRASPSKIWWLVHKILKTFLLSNQQTTWAKQSQPESPSWCLGLPRKQILPDESLHGDVDTGAVNVQIYHLVSFVNSKDDREQHYHTQAHSPECQDLALLTLKLVNVGCLCTPASTMCYFLYDTGKTTPQA